MGVSWPAKRRYALLFGLTMMISGCLLFWPLDFYAPDDWEEKRLCYLWTANPPTNLKFLPNISKDPIQQGKSIFFHETSCSSEDQRIDLNARQACAIESAAKANPGRTVYVLFTSPRIMNNSSIISTLLKYSNIKLRNVDIWNYSQGTIVQDWINDNVLFTSDYVSFHLSDFMRYLSLNKYGGSYLDMDIIVKKNFDSMASQNFAGAESVEDVAAGIISFDESPFGGLMSLLCLRDFKLHFSGKEWGNNGPGVITRVLQTVCSTDNTTQMTPERCHGFRVLPPSKCYGVPFRKWERFFDPDETQDVLSQLRDSVIVHFWNKFSITRKVTKGDRSAYDLLAREYCPLVYAVAEERF